MSTLWFERGPNDVAATGVTEPETLLVGNPVPDWVRAPPGLGDLTGREFRVLSSSQEKCPMPCDLVVRHLSVEEGLNVAECPAHGFTWYRRRT